MNKMDLNMLFNNNRTALRTTFADWMPHGTWYLSEANKVQLLLGRNDLLDHKINIEEYATEFKQLKQGTNLNRNTRIDLLYNPEFCYQK